MVGFTHGALIAELEQLNRSPYTNHRYRCNVYELTDPRYQIGNNQRLDDDLILGYEEPFVLGRTGGRRPTRLTWQREEGNSEHIGTLVLSANPPTGRKAARAINRYLAGIGYPGRIRPQNIQLLN